MADAETPDRLISQHQHHPRDWRENLYVYPVISRRSGGLSIGVNLNPDTACNFDCVYCQVDRSGQPRTRSVHLPRLRDELTRMIDRAVDESLFADPAFADVPTDLRRIHDIAFSGDGEPTTCTQFRQCVELVADLMRKAALSETKIVLITNACYLTTEPVREGLAVLGQNNGEIWAKLDAGTEAYYRTINRSNFPLAHVMRNIVETAKVQPIIIQSIFMRLEGEPPDTTELLAYTDRLNEITQARGQIDHVQVYTIARRPAERYVSGLTHAEVDRIVELVRTRTGLRARAFYGIAD